MAVQSSSSTPAFTLTVRGVDVIGNPERWKNDPTGPVIPLENAPIIVNEVGSEATGTLTATISDPAADTTLLIGSEVVFKDNRTTAAGVSQSSGRTLFGGVMLSRIYRARPGGGRYIDITATQFDWWLDHRIVPKYVRAANVSDKHMVANLLALYAGTIDSVTYVNETRALCNDVKFLGGTLREALQEIAQTAAGGTPGKRRFYVDGNKYLHWFSGNEGLTAPYRIADSSYTTVVLATSGLVSLWSLREESGTTAHDAKVYANGTLNGGYTQGVTNVGVVNEPQMRALTLNGTTGYVSATGANLHPGNTFSIEGWFKTSYTALEQTIWSGGTDDVLIGLTTAGRFQVEKEGTGDQFLSASGTSYADGAWHHFMVTREPADTDVFIDGVDITSLGADTARTFVAGSATINIGRAKAGTNEFWNGQLQHIAVYSTKLGSVGGVHQSALHYNQGRSLSPEDLEFETAAGEYAAEVYVKGKTGVASGPAQQASGFGTQMQPQAFIDRPNANTAAKKANAAADYLATHGSFVTAGSFSITGYDGWRAGQTIYITSVALGLSGTAYSIRELTMDCNLGNGVLTYDIDFGALRPSFRRMVAKRKD